MIQAALETGCRVGELLGLRWCDVDFDQEGVPRRIQFSARTMKTSKTRRVPVTRRLAAMISGSRKGPDGRDHGPLAYVFGNEAGERIARIAKGWTAGCERAGIEGLHFHDLRPEFGLRLHERGVPLSSIQAALDHSNIVITSRYLRIEEEALGGVYALLG